MAAKNVISLLPNSIAKDVIKINLDFVKEPNEVSRAIYFVPPGGSVKKHVPKDISVIYISLSDMMYRGTQFLRDIPDVIGDNSPTGKHEYSVDESPHPQVFLVIQREVTKDAWADLAESIITNKFQAWLKKLNVCGVLEKNIMSLVFSDRTKTKQIYVDVDFIENRVSYLSSSQQNVQDIVDETKSLDELKNNLLQSDLGRGK